MNISQPGRRFSHVTIHFTIYHTLVTGLWWFHHEFRNED